MSGLYGDRAKRVSTSQMRSVFCELYEQMGHEFDRLELTKTLPAKTEHGDIDILALAEPNTDPIALITKCLGKQVLDCVKNDNIYSLLYHSDCVGPVHVDLILATTEGRFALLKQYYVHNGLSALIGMVARRLNYKYGTNGFYRRYEDKNGRWYDILISTDLNDGLRILGYNPLLLAGIRTADDMADFVASSPLFSSSFIECTKDLVRRQLLSGICAKLIAMAKQPDEIDEEVYLRTLYPNKFSEIMSTISKIGQSASIRSERYNGDWLQVQFGLKPGPKIGAIIKKLSDEFGDALDDTEESIVANYVNQILRIMP